MCNHHDTMERIFKINNKMIKKMDKKIIIDSRRILADSNINVDYNAIGIGDNV